MNRLSTHAQIVLVVAALTAQIATAEVPPPTDTSAPTVLVLRNGEVLQGEISQQDDRYLVVLPTGRVFVPQDDVEAACRTLEEAYRRKAMYASGTQAHDHAQLAQWCQRHGLTAQAEQQLEIARQLDPDHPLIELIQRRVDAAKRPRATPVEPVSPVADSRPTAAQLSDFSASLPAGTIEAFRRSVQPILLNRCVTAGCHSERSECKFRLLRPRPGMPLAQQATQRNLLSTLQLVDQQAPDRSELLRPDKCPHRLSADTNLMLSRSGQYRFLVDWVHAISRESVVSPTMMPHAITTANPLVHSAQPVSSLDAGNGAVPASATLPLDSEAVAAGQPQATQPSAIPGPFDQPKVHRPNEAVGLPARATADPFDPAVFNERYGTVAPPPENSAATIPSPSGQFAPE